MKKVHPVLRPDALTCVCAGLIVCTIAIVMILALFGLREVMISDSPDGPDGLGVFLACGLLLVSVTLLIAEYLAILRCNLTASSLIIAVLVYFSGYGVVGWCRKVVGFLHPPDRPGRSASLAELAFLAAVVALAIFVSVGHLRWHLRLVSAADEDDPGRGIDHL